ncbi:MAG TPA: aminotransferase class V-fold PLP-dependent enzyme [Sphingomicrobium sp.]|nr:aminotransferase class V-fold PLP-dependent enzyme [Sphingomicrobium sp.]
MRSRVRSYIGTGVQVAIGRKLVVLGNPERIYLDHAATTPMLPEAQLAVSAAMEAWANPSSPHADGRRARAAFEDARRSIAKALGWRHDVILTSGASEGVQIAASRAKVARRMVGATEHEVVPAAMGPDSIILRVDGKGLVDLAELEQELKAGPALVAIQIANNETGVIQPIELIQNLVRQTGSLLLADCAQGAGKIVLPEVDFASVSAHKFGGPPGVGALLVRDLETLEPSGGQERGYRRGTENWPSTAGMAAALSTRAFVEAMPRLEQLRRSLEQEIVAAGGVVIGAGAPRIATIGNYAMPGVASASQLIQFDLAGISISAGSACSSGSMKPSRVLMAMGVPEELAGTVIRVSFGEGTSKADIERFLDVWRDIHNRAKARAA